jgi:preprotein translocase subunit SecA
MRELERFVILQVVDQRWREHLENMDYLREGVHLGRWPRRTHWSSTPPRGTGCSRS